MRGNSRYISLKNEMMLKQTEKMPGPACSEGGPLLCKIHASSGLHSIRAHTRIFFKRYKINLQLTLDSEVFKNAAVSSHNLPKRKTVVKMKPLSKRECSLNKWVL